jgi:hypothetical protein
MDAAHRSPLFSMTGRLALLAVIVVVDFALVHAHHAQPRVNVVTVAPQAVGPHVATSGGGGVAPPAANGTGTTGPVTDGSCSSAAPDSTWTCKNGAWTPPSGVGMGAMSLNSCASVSPGPSFVCQNGVWALASNGSVAPAANTAAATPATASATTNANATATGAATNLGPIAAAAMTAASAATPDASATPGAPQVPAAPATSPPTCVGQAPSVAWTCRSGVWVLGSGGGD